MRFKLYRCIACVMLFLGGILVFGSSNVFAAITELYSLAEFTGEAGLSTVYYLGDVNGDGYKDFSAVTCAYNSDQGRVYIFYGGDSLVDRRAVDADVILTGEAVNNRFGYTNSGGDVNNDGYDDVVVGARVYNAQQGRVYIFYGGASLNTKNASDADVIFTGESTDRFGGVIAPVNDVNKDSYDDIIVGAEYYNNTVAHGRVYIFYGGSSISSESAADADIKLTGEAANDRLADVITNGDVNNDGYDDIITGARLNDQGGLNVGRLYIFYGGPSLSSKDASSADVIFTGETDSGYFGYNPSSGDINRDGYDDIIVGAFGYDGNRGRVYVFYGGPSLANKGAAEADVIFTGENTGDYLGAYLSSIGDINNDGYDDIIVGAYGYASNQGRAYIFYGGASLTSKGASEADIILDGENAGDYFGNSLSSLSDMNSDGWKEWGIGAYGYSAGDAQGKAYLYNLNYASPSISMGNAFYVNTPSPTVTGTASETGVNVAGVQISINNGAWSACSASDGVFNSASEAFSCPLSGLSEGTYALRVRSYDENNVYVPSSLYAMADLVVDFTPPSDGVVTISAGGSYTNSQTVTLNITAFDALAGVNQMMISEDPNFEGAEWQPYSETVEFTLSGESGTKVIYVRFMDRAGNVSGVYSYSVELLTETGGDMRSGFVLGGVLLYLVMLIKVLAVSIDQWRYI